MGGRRCRAWFFCFAAALLERWAVHAQVVEFDDYPVPTPRSIGTAYVFFVYNFTEAPDKSQGAPYLEFEGLRAHSMDPQHSDSWSENMGVQVTALRHMDVDKLLRLNAHQGDFCSTSQDVAMGRSPAPNKLLIHRSEFFHNGTAQAYQQVVTFGQAAPTVRWAINRTGIWMLLISNCGNVKQAYMDGTVTLKHAYGYLPGNEYPKMPFYGWLVLAYIGCTVVWVVLSVRWWSQLFRIQSCILVVLLLGVGESLLWNIFFHQWNIEGTPSDKTMALFVAATLFTVLKSTFSYMLVLVASLGWGVTRPQLDNMTVCKISCLCVVYVGLAFTREVVLAFRHSYSIPVSLVLTVFAPVSVMNAVIFCWIFSAIGSLMEKLRKEHQTEKFQLFLTLFAVLIAAIGVATLALFVEVYNLSRPPQRVWKHQWVLTDAVNHLLFLMVLVAMMYLWAPHSQSQRYAYSEQLSNVDMDGDPPHRSVRDGDLRKLGGGEVIGQAYIDEDGPSPRAAQDRPAVVEPVQRDEV